MQSHTEVQKQEDRIQQEMVMRYNNTYCREGCIPRCMIYHVPNQNQQHLVGIGVLPGVGDLVVIHATHTHPIGVHYYFEVKTPMGKQSPAQESFQSRIEALGYKYMLVRTMDEFWYYIQEIHNSLS